MPLKMDMAFANENGNQNYHLSKKIRNLKLKWSGIPNLGPLIAQSTSRYPEWILDLFFLQKFMISLAGLVILPLLAAYLGILIDNGFNASAFHNSISKDESCLMHTPLTITEMARPMVNCMSVCQGMDEVPIVEDMTKEEFLKSHAYSGRPVLVRHATMSWTAGKVFSFLFFKNLFLPLIEAREHEEEEELHQKDYKECQFFPYNTEFIKLKDFFNITEARARLDPREKSYYVGWANCFHEAINELRKHYQKPAFLPENSEASTVDWIFMGGSSSTTGGGAPIHIDHVGRPSWQALVSGHKTWLLYPPPECESVCKNELRVDMQQGDIIVVDTNIWFHGTKVDPNLLTISIGSEYD